MNVNVKEMNVDPGFVEAPLITHELATFTKYRLPQKSILRTMGLDLKTVLGLKLEKETSIRKNFPYKA